MSIARNIPTYGKLDPVVEQLCFSTWSCKLSVTIADVWTHIAVGLAVGLPLTKLAYLRTAKAELKEEQSRTAAGLEAYSSFAERVAEMPTSAAVETDWSNDGGLSTLAATNLTGSTVREVRTIYRDAVMAVPHYEEDYAESLEEYMVIGRAHSEGLPDWKAYLSLDDTNTNEIKS